MRPVGTDETPGPPVERERNPYLPLIHDPSRARGGSSYTAGPQLIMRPLHPRCTSSSESLLRAPLPLDKPLSHHHATPPPAANRSAPPSASPRPFPFPFPAAKPRRTSGTQATTSTRSRSFLPRVPGLSVCRRNVDRRRSPSNNPRRGRGKSRRSHADPIHPRGDIRSRLRNGNRHAMVRPGTHRHRHHHRHRRTPLPRPAPDGRPDDARDVQPLQAKLRDGSELGRL